LIETIENVQFYTTYLR